MSEEPEARIKETGVLTHLFGVWYPTHYVVGVLEDRSSADRAADTLRAAWRAAGDQEDPVRLFHPEDAREAIRRTEGFYGAAKRAMAALSREVGSEEAVADQDYTTAVTEGHSILTVHTPTHVTVERVRAALVDFEVRHLRYYGPLAMTDLRTTAE